MSRFSKILLFFTVAAQFLTAVPVLAQTVATSKFIPPCALENPTGKHMQDGSEGDCRSISIYIILALNVVNYLFGIVGALALLFFIYGGFTMILSRGNSEQTKKGMEIITAAIIGLIVVFGAYMLVRFLGTAVGLKTEFRLN